MGRPARRRGFTFIELTIVVTIIAILAAILFPVFARAREKASQCRCLTNLQQIGLALSLYARDHAGHFPPTDDDVTPLLGRYLLMEEALQCPTADKWRTSEMRSDTPDERHAPIPPFDYYYRGGFCDDDDPLTLIACDSQLDRHNEGANGLLADGHVKWFKDQSGSLGANPSEYPLVTIVKERGLALGVGVP